MNSTTDISKAESTPVCSQWESALYSWPAHLRVWLVTIVGAVVDLWSKDWAFTTIELRNKRAIITNVLSFQPSLNSGALWGMGEGFAPLFVIASLFALIFVLYIFSKSQRSQYSFHLALGMVLAGALGNLYDRVFGGGQVRDFIRIDLAVGGHDIWPWIFNGADVFLVCGVGILLLNIWFDRHITREPKREPPTASA